MIKCYFLFILVDQQIELYINICTDYNGLAFLNRPLARLIPLKYIYLPWEFDTR